MKNRLSSPLSSSAANATGVAAALALLANEAAAAVQVFIPDPQPFTAGYNSSRPYGIAVDPASGSITDASSSSNGLVFCLSSSMNYGGLVPYYDGQHEYVFASDIVNVNGNERHFASRLNQGDMVDSSTATDSQFMLQVNPADYTLGDAFFLGYGFRDKGSSDLYNYGWMELSYASDGSVSIYSWGYEDVPGIGTSAGVAAVPEPSQVALVIGGLSLAAVTVRKHLRKPRQS